MSDTDVTAVPQPVLPESTLEPVEIAENPFVPAEIVENPFVPQPVAPQPFVPAEIVENPFVPKPIAPAEIVENPFVPQPIAPQPIVPPSVHDESPLDDDNISDDPDTLPERTIPIKDASGWSNYTYINKFDFIIMHRDL